MSFLDFLLVGREHAFLSPSSARLWLGKDKEYLKKKIKSDQARFIGTIKHELAERDIRLRMKRPNTSNTFYMYVNDAIGYRMEPEVPLKYSKWCYGTADALCFRDGLLRIHDLKTGSSKTTMDQLVVYAALYCLQHDITPSDIQIELRIYQSGDVLVHEPDLDEIVHAIDYIKTASKWLDEIMVEVN